MPGFQMNVYKDGKIIFKRALVWLVVLIVLILFSPWGSGTGIVSPAVSRKDAAPTPVNPSPTVTTTPPAVVAPTPVTPSPTVTTKPPVVVAPTLVNPSPSVKVSTKTTTVNAGTIQTGDFSVTIEFTVAANVSKVTLFLEASDLYRGGDTTDPRKIGPIALNTGRPVEIIVPSGTRIAGPPNNVSWLGTGNPIANFPGKKTETVTYEFSQKSDVTQNVSCKIWYGQENKSKTSGQYSGQVRLNASVAP